MLIDFSKEDARRISNEFNERRRFEAIEITINFVINSIKNAAIEGKNTVVIPIDEHIMKDTDKRNALNEYLGKMNFHPKLLQTSSFAGKIDISISW